MKNITLTKEQFFTINNCPFYAVKLTHQRIDDEVHYKLNYVHATTKDKYLKEDDTIEEFAFDMVDWTDVKANTIEEIYDDICYIQFVTSINEFKDEVIGKVKKLLSKLEEYVKYINHIVKNAIRVSKIHRFENTVISYNIEYGFNKKSYLQRLVKMVYFQVKNNFDGIEYYYLKNKL